MKIRFGCNSGANIHSERYEVFELSDLGYTEDEWKNLSDEGKQSLVNEWAWERLEIYFQEVE